MRIDLGRFVQKQRGNLRKFARELPAPIRRQLFYARGFGAGPMGLPRLPWKLAEPDPNAEIVATFEGAFEPQRKAKFYGAPFTPSPPVPRTVPVTLRRVSNVILLPHQVTLRQSDRAVLPVSYGTTNENYWLRHRPGKPGYVDYDFDGDVEAPRAIEEEVFVADALFPIFGHTLMDVVPMLPLLARAPAGIKVATSSPIIRPLFEGSGVEVERLVRFKGPLFCRSALIADPPVDLSGNMHAVARQAFERLEALALQSTIELRPRIYLSRRQVPIRSLVNEAAIEALFERLGFAIIHPQHHSIPDQIRLMRNAEMVAGAAGSNMHNLLYVRPETKALILASRHWFVPIDLTVARRDWQFAFVIGEPRRGYAREEHSRSWTIDIGAVEQAIHEHFGLTPA